MNTGAGEEDQTRRKRGRAYDRARPATVPGSLQHLASTSPPSCSLHSPRLVLVGGRSPFFLLLFVRCVYFVRCLHHISIFSCSPRRFNVASDLRSYPPCLPNHLYRPLNSKPLPR